MALDCIDDDAMRMTKVLNVGWLAEATTKNAVDATARVVFKLGSMWSSFFHACEVQSVGLKGSGRLPTVPTGKSRIA